MSDWGPYAQVHPDATILRRWVVVRRFPVGNSFLTRGFSRHWTRRGAERLARRWRSGAAASAKWDAERGVRPANPEVLVLDMREHPARVQP